MMLGRARGVINHCRRTFHFNSPPPLSPPHRRPFPPPSPGRRGSPAETVRRSRSSVYRRHRSAAPGDADSPFDPFRTCLVSIQLPLLYPPQNPTFIKISKHLVVSRIPRGAPHTVSKWRPTAQTAQDEPNPPPEAPALLQAESFPQFRWPSAGPRPRSRRRKSRQVQM